MGFPAHAPVGARHNNGTVEWAFDGTAWRVTREPLPPRPKIVKPTLLLLAALLGGAASQFLRTLFG